MKTALVGLIALLVISFGGPAIASPSAGGNPAAVERYEARHADRLRAKQIITELRAAHKAERRAERAL